ncbi:zinc ribbon domain-containing protein [Propionibacterium sp.]|uniref:zinc ribbon domain-containing protein n=1 Tax=Propionibacterium sp. TaxID=1977903 RepID=UPI0039ECA270
MIRYKGALHPGAHEPLIEPVLFDQVQSLLKARNTQVTRHVQHAHHLKGLVHCGSCGSRMLLDLATNPRGTTYAYFVCSDHATKKTAHPPRGARAGRRTAGRELLRQHHDQRSRLRHLAAEVDAAFDKRFAGLTANREQLKAEGDKLLAAHFADAINLPTLKRHQDRIRTGLAEIEQCLSQHDEQHTGGRAFLHDSLRLLTDAHCAYTHPDDGSRRLANQAFYTRLEIPEDEELRSRLAEPFATIVHRRTEARKPNGMLRQAQRPGTAMSRIPGRLFGWALLDLNQ